MQCRRRPPRNQPEWKVKQRTLKCRQPRALIVLFPHLLRCRWVLAEREGLGGHCGSVLPAGAEAPAEARLGLGGRERHRVAVHESCRLRPVRISSSVRSSPQRRSSFQFFLFSAFEGSWKKKAILPKEPLPADADVRNLTLGFTTWDSELRMNKGGRLEAALSLCSSVWQHDDQHHPGNTSRHTSENLLQTLYWRSRRSKGTKDEGAAWERTHLFLSFCTELFRGANWTATTALYTHVSYLFVF